MRQAGGNLSTASGPAAEDTAGNPDLLARLRRGDAAAAQEFYALYARRIYRFILHALGGDAEGV